MVRFMIIVQWPPAKECKKHKLLHDAQSECFLCRFDKLLEREFVKLHRELDKIFQTKKQKV